jgi:N-acetyl-gamma-glutamyl-phosphate reductase
MIERYESFSAEERERYNTRPYALGLKHKHVPEMHKFSGTARAPLFAPSVGYFAQGMLVHVPLFTCELNGAPTPEDIHAVLARRYAGEAFVRVYPPGAEGTLDGGYLSATACNDTNRIELMVFGNTEQLLLTARYDNLGKGAAGAAVQNLNLMLGVCESTALDE